MISSACWQVLGHAGAHEEEYEREAQADFHAQLFISQTTFRSDLPVPVPQGRQARAVPHKLMKNLEFLIFLA